MTRPTSMLLLILDPEPGSAWVDWLVVRGPTFDSNFLRVFCRFEMSCRACRFEFYFADWRDLIASLFPFSALSAMLIGGRW